LIQAKFRKSAYFSARLLRQSDTASATRRKRIDNTSETRKKAKTPPLEMLKRLRWRKQYFNTYESLTIFYRRKNW
jgi:hypothetical protein